ncbi:hypothetical protein Tco_1238693 [Tanacetum coccineum]
MKCVNSIDSSYFTAETFVYDSSECSPRLRIYKLLSRKFWINMKHISESIKIKTISLSVQLESNGMLMVRGRSLEFMHVDSKDTCSDQEGWIKSCNFQSVDVVPVEREHRPGLVVVLL